MNRKDIYTIIAVIIGSSIVAFVVSNYVFSAEKTRNKEVEVVNAISEQFILPSKTHFNDQAINPTQLILIGNDSNQTPFDQ